MIENDTVRLLRECDAGIKMGVQSISDVAKFAKSRELKRSLAKYKSEHQKLADEIESLLHSYGDKGKAPNPIATGMSRMKTVMKLNLEKSDSTIAELMTDGCNMGIKSLSGYLNKYQAADEESKDITKRLIGIEDQLATDMRAYLQ